jgi:hypothetical protein
LRLYPYRFLRWCLNRVHTRTRLPFVFYLHPWEIDEHQPRLNVTGFSKFRHYNNLHRSRARLDRLLADFRFDTCEAVLQSLAIEAPATSNYSVAAPR